MSKVHGYRVPQYSYRSSERLNKRNLAKRNQKDSFNMIRIALHTIIMNLTELTRNSVDKHITYFGYFFIQY